MSVIAWTAWILGALSIGVYSYRTFTEPEEHETPALEGTRRLADQPTRKETI